MIQTLGLAKRFIQVFFVISYGKTQVNFMATLIHSDHINEMHKLYE